MKRGLYARLAWTGMVKNKRLYLPYGLSAAGMVLMFYILTGLSGSPVLEHMSGGGSSAIILRLGTVVIAVFALIFLFYTHSFLIAGGSGSSACTMCWAWGRAASPASCCGRRPLPTA